MPGYGNPASLLKVHPESGGQYTFIHLSGSRDGRAHHVRKDIHCHTMRRNGLARRRKPRHVTIELQLKQVHYEQSSARCRTDASQRHPQSSSPPTGRHNCLLHASVDASGLGPLAHDRRTRELLQFTAVDQQFYRPFRALFVRMALFDSSARKLVLANAAVFCDQQWRPAREAFCVTPEAAAYYLQSCRELSRRFDDPRDRLSDGVIATVLGFLCHDANVCNWDRFVLHFGGLQKLVHMRGGLYYLSDHMSLLASWLDLIGAAVAERSPVFNAPISAMPESVASSKSMPKSLTSILHQVDRWPGLAHLSHILVMLFTVSQQVDSAHAGPSFWRDETTAIRLLAPLSHALLSLSSPTSSGGSTDASVLFEITRLTCLMLVAELKTLFSFHASELDALRRTFTSLLESSDMSWINYLPDLALWSLVSTALAMDDSSMPVMSRAISYAMSARGIESASEAVQRAAEIIWIEAIESKAVRSLIYEIDGPGEEHQSWDEYTSSHDQQ